MPKKEPKETIITLDLSAELVGVIEDMGYDAKGYFTLMVRDLETRLETRIKDEVVADNKATVDSEVDKSKSKTKVTSKVK